MREIIKSGAEKTRKVGFYRGINLQHGKFPLVQVFDVFLQRATSRGPVQIVNVIARAGPIDADERQRYAENSGVHRVHQGRDIFARDELLLDRRLRPTFQFARWYVAAGYPNLIRILELLSCNQSFFFFFLLFSLSFLPSLPPLLPSRLQKWVCLLRVTQCVRSRSWQPIR